MKEKRYVVPFGYIEIKVVRFEGLPENVIYYGWDEKYDFYLSGMGEEDEGAVYGVENHDWYRGEVRR